MSLKTLLFVALFVAAVVGAVVQTPLYGVLGYIGHYCIGPERQWWHAPLRGLGLRYSLILSGVTALSMAVNWRKLRFQSLLVGQEKLMLLFLAVVWLSAFVNPETVGRYETGASDPPHVKLVKILVFAFMLSHVATQRASVRKVLWTLVVGAMVLGMQAYDVPRRAFRQGRLESVGGADFRDANRLGGFMASMLFVIGAQFMNSGGWWGRGVSFLAGGFTANAVILTRSRGALLGLGAGMAVAAILAPRKYRGVILVGLALAGAGVVYLSDPQTARRAGTVTASGEERDASASTRLEIWEGGAKMFAANPVLGVGPGNFYENIGRYQPLHPGRDAHNTFVRCAGELGVPGIAVLILLIVNAARTLLRCIRESHRLPSDAGKELLWMSFGCLTGLVAVLTYGMTGTLVYTEYLWWMLILPVCLQRVLENELEDVASGVEMEPAGIGPAARALDERSLRPGMPRGGLLR